MIIKQFLWVALGGGIGSVLRFMVSRFMYTSIQGSFPWGTFTVNILGSFVIGLLWALSVKNANFSDTAKLFLVTGICGGFTTFSTFSMESVALIRDQKIFLFLAYALGSMVLGFLATFAAYKLIRNF